MQQAKDKDWGLKANDDEIAHSKDQRVRYKRDRCPNYAYCIIEHIHYHTNKLYLALSILITFVILNRYWTSIEQEHGLQELFREKPFMQ